MVISHRFWIQEGFYDCISLKNNGKLKLLHQNSLSYIVITGLYKIINMLFFFKKESRVKRRFPSVASLRLFVQTAKGSPYELQNHMVILNVIIRYNLPYCITADGLFLRK